MIQTRTTPTLRSQLEPALQSKSKPKIEVSVQRLALESRLEKALDRGNASLAQKLQLELAAFDVLTSDHITGVEIVFTGESEGSRIYLARTNDTGKPHEYRLTVRNDEKHGRLINCTCASSAKEQRIEETDFIAVEPVLCRHAIALAVVDSTLTGAPLNFSRIAKYTAHKTAKTAKTERAYQV